jgi:hypothetical protein
MPACRDHAVAAASQSPIGAVSRRRSVAEKTVLTVLSVLTVLTRSAHPTISASNV